jgi:hypothetical protein
LLHTTEAPLTKLLPVTVSVKPADPAAALAGEMDEMAGAPDGGGGGGGGG